jgi:outer membrane protein OmpA-like peptidoglycan-associated protein
MRYVVVVCLVLVGCSRTSPTVSLSANTPSVTQGECATLTWSSTDAATVSIDQGVGQVESRGSKQVCPESSTQYTITAAGDGVSRSASTSIGVTALGAKVMTFPEAALFEFGKAELKPEGKEKIREYREEAKAELSRADQVAITGYTDNVGEADHNATLSLQRAEAVRDQLISLGADPSKFHVSGAGETNPIVDNSTDEGRAKNRRVEVAVLGVGR